MEIKGFNQHQNKKKDDKESPAPEKKRRKPAKKELPERILEQFFLKSFPTRQDGTVQVNRSTLEIMDELSEMMDVPKFKVIEFMVNNGYQLTTEEDGSVKWAIWRFI